MNLSGFDAHQKPRSAESHPGPRHRRPEGQFKPQFNISQSLAQGFRVWLWILAPLSLPPCELGH